MTGKKLINILAPHLGERYVLGAVAPKNDPNYKGPWDCAEFCSWGIYQISKKLYGCVNDNANPAVADAYTGSWKYDSDKQGKIISTEEAASIAGACILRYSGGTIGHIVVSLGNGNTIEAHSSKTGVIQNIVSGRRWDRGILVPGITYEKAGKIQVAAPVKIYRWTTPLMSGSKVKEIQKALISKSYSVGKWGADGYYGSGTAQGVRSYQRDNGLVPDGEVGPETASSLGIML
jgi:hypothetical protein